LFEAFLDQELIYNRYSLKKPEARRFNQIGTKFDKIVFQVNMHRSMESDLI